MTLTFLNTKETPPEPNRQILMKDNDSYYTVGYDDVDDEFYCASQGPGWDMARLYEHPQGIEYAYLD